MEVILLVIIIPSRSGAPCLATGLAGPCCSLLSAKLLNHLINISKSKTSACCYVTLLFGKWTFLFHFVALYLLYINTSVSGQTDLFIFFPLQIGHCSCIFSGISTTVQPQYLKKRERDQKLFHTLGHLQADGKFVASCRSIAKIKNHSCRVASPLIKLLGWTKAHMGF